MIEEISFNISLYEYKIYIKEIYEPEKTIKTPLEYSSVKNEKEKSQRGDIHEMSDEKIIQSNSKNSNENLLSSKSLDEAKKEKEKQIASAYPNGYKIKLDIINNEEIKKFYKRIDDICNILKESTFILIINYHKEIKIKFEKIIYKKREKREKTEIVEEIEITYEEFTTLSEEEKEQKYELDEYYNLFGIYYKKLIEFLDKIIEIANKKFSEINLQNELLIKINIKEDKNKNTDKNNKIINSEYINENLFSKKMIQYYCYQDRDILNHCDYKGFTSFSEKIIELEKPSSNNEKGKQNLEQENNNNNSTKNESNSKISIKLIGKQKKNAQIVRELDDGSILSDGRIINFKIINDPNNVYKNKEIIIRENHIDYKYFSGNNYNNIDISNIGALYPCMNIFKLKDGKYIIYSEIGIYKCSNIFNSGVKIEYSSLSKNAYIGGIKINDEIIAFIPKSNESKKENELKINSLDFYNAKLKKHLNDIIFENYSFLLSGNNCPIMKIPKIEDNKLLLVACKNYNGGDKNGILLIKMRFNEDEIKKTYLKFYNTNNFEVYCFCPLFKIKKYNK